MEAIAGMPLDEILEPVAEDDIRLPPGRMEVDDVVDVTVSIERAQHAHDRGDPAARADEEELFGSGLWEHEVAFHSSQSDDLTGSRLANEIRRHLASLDQLGGDA